MADEVKIERAHEEEAQLNPRMCEIRFDCLVSMYEKEQRLTPGFRRGDSLNRPQWFKAQRKITLEAIKHHDEFTLGRMLKEMLAQLESHIDRYHTPQ